MQIMHHVVPIVPSHGSRALLKYEDFFSNLEDHPSGCKWLITMVVVNQISSKKTSCFLGGGGVGWLVDIRGVIVGSSLKSVWTRMMKELEVWCAHDGGLGMKELRKLNVHKYSRI